MGLAHPLFTFRGPKLLPRDPELQARMQEASPVITRQTTMWKCWIGFNASHSVALILFGAVYAYLALAHGDDLFRSVFLLSLGGLVLLGCVFLAKMYFFRTPLSRRRPGHFSLCRRAHRQPGLIPLPRAAGGRGRAAGLG